ncbi:MAG: hypothetical protein EAZ42_03905 [Verrucomicrobia bacterium]|nr:MAG: hypothetical protein EAZ42_03905 [Verrucomicrobiota bacterium]
MPAPQKGYKTINHHDVQYRWIMQNLRGESELIVFAADAVRGQRLIAKLPKIVSYDRVTEAIDFAKTNGWMPHQAGNDFHCAYRRGAFHLDG